MKWIAPHGAATSTERYRNAEPTIAGSNPDAAFFNTVLDELLAVIVAADMTPTDQNLHQIADAIEYLTERAATSGVTKGAFWFGKTTDNFTVPNPTLAEQNYIDFTTLNTYSAKSDLSGWTQTGTFVPPVGIDFTILITSKFWDIPEQDGQQGGWAQYNHTDDEWSWWPKIINLDNAANLSLSNLNTNGKNITNWSSNVANCITEIPQDINIVKNNDCSFTLKAGSKLYKPNGVGVFDTYTVPNDITFRPTAFNDTYLYFLKSDGTKYYVSDEKCFSGTTAPTGFAGNHAAWYDTTNNLIKYTDDAGSTWKTGLTFPIGWVNCVASTSLNIKSIFNGVGFIGSTLFVLPGLKGLIPNGFNADGTLKNSKINCTEVKTLNVNGNTSIYIALGSTGQPAWWSKSATEYKKHENKNYYNNNPSTFALCGLYNVKNNQITDFDFNSVLHAVDYSDYQELKDDVPKQIATLLQTMYPVGSVYIGTQTTCPMASLISGSTWTVVATKIITDITGIKGAVGTSSASSNGKYFVAQTSSFGQNTEPAVGGYNMNVSTNQTITGASVTNSSITVNVWRRTA